MTATPSSSGDKPLPRQPGNAAAWELIHDDVFEHHLDDGALARLVAERRAASREPHAELMRLMVGMSLPEEEARSLFARIIERRREMSRALGRPVHIRVAALDLLTTRPRRRRDSRPIMVAPELLERVLEEAGADAVTGLSSRAHFVKLLQYELLQRRRRVVLVYIDLDGFKRVNDEHGHARGDEVLRTLAAAARSTLRRGDVVARLGGDEFGFMLVDVSLEEATLAVHRLRSRFEALTASLSTSFSAGIAVAAPAITAEELLEAADRAMYADKRRRSAR